ncbi:MAG: hypothetical protein M3O78_02795 [Chloroflexota bacterium]|nr:hypothetical protein [Chloroflexota bacterium]
MMVKDRPGAAELTLLRGVLFTLRRKCGKPSCRCATGEAHESPALAYPAGGRTKTMTLTEQDVARVSAALERYRVAREELDSAADADIVTLQAQIASRRQHRRA